jgi:hypothetical protein
MAAFSQANAKHPDQQVQKEPAHTNLRDNQHPKLTNHRTKWNKPDPNYFKVNSDANLQVAGRWGIGCIIRNEEGEVQVSATWSRNGFACPSTAEAFSIYAAMVLAAAAGGFRDVIFESVIEKLKSKRTGDRTYLRYGRLVTPRQGNQVAHCLAHLAHSD